MRSSKEEPLPRDGGGDDGADSGDSSYSEGSSGEIGSSEDRSSGSDPTASIRSVKKRDEVKELKNAARKDTRRIQLGRFFVIVALLGTAATIISLTYKNLVYNENQDFQTAYEQFSRSVINAAKEQQKSIRQSYRAISDAISSEAFVSNATWPFFTMPRFELAGYATLVRSRTEILNVIPIVSSANRNGWEQYAERFYQDWVQESYDVTVSRDGDAIREQFIATGFTRYIWEPDENFNLVPATGREMYLPSWTFSPPPFSFGLVNADLGFEINQREVIKAAIALRNESVISKVVHFSGAGGLSREQHEKTHSKLPDSSIEHPHSFVYEPVHIDPDDYESQVVALVYGVQAWDASLQNLLPDGVNGIIAVIRNNCNQSYTYAIDGSQAILIGNGDLHETNFDGYEKVVQLSSATNPKFASTPGHCMFNMHVYPSSTFENSYRTDTPAIFAIVVASSFGLVIVVFIIYDMFVQRRNDKILQRTARSNAIVSSLFPESIREKLIGEKASTPVRRRSHGSLRTFMTDGVHGEQMLGEDHTSKPLADLFLDTTVMFADIVGFTAWSSTREPSQVFMLLETLYGAFDEIANARRVFKVETVGDCYVAATGMPDPRRDHAVAMCRFARDVMNKMNLLVRELEVTLGPDTGDLSARIGIHSGPVTAGVLRGERARFQLFGDTMNTTARIESNGMPGRIHLSQETAEILIQSGKSHWIEKREGLVSAKGKGQIQTYWLTSAFNRSKDQGTVSGGSEASSSRASEIAAEVEADEDAQRTARRVDWLTESFVGILKQIVALRKAKELAGCQPTQPALQEDNRTEHVSFLDEVKEIIRLPEFDREAAKNMQDPGEVIIEPAVVKQLHHYVSCIAKMYRPNSFHNFEHASHVTMSVLKLLSRIIAPQDEAEDEEDMVQDDTEGEGAATLHDHTYGITSDPLTHFACAFSSLIHDVDHSGAPNVQLIKENSALAAVYGHRSIAEQNSLALAYDLLMDRRYKALRATIYADEVEQRRFRELVVNSVMATDIVDKDLKNLRNGRWEKAFKTEQPMNEDPRDAINRKATIVIEHLIQASDVAHTMQHWHVYRKWNERFFVECYNAYKDGRAETDPSENWYKGEIGFYDFYIIPLAKKLKECGVFGKSSDEYLNYAIMNRQEWEARGQEVVAEMVEKVNKLYAVSSSDRKGKRDTV